MQINLFDSRLLVDLLQHDLRRHFAHLKAWRDDAGLARRGGLANLQPVKTGNRHGLGHGNSGCLTLL